MVYYCNWAGCREGLLTDLPYRGMQQRHERDCRKVHGMIVIPLIQKIAELFLILFCAAALVRAGIVRTEDSKVLSRISLYFVTPCVIFNAFQKELTPEVLQGMGAALVLSVLFHITFILIALLFKKLFNATEVERACVIFTNCGNLIIPIVSYVFGPEWVIYVSCSMVVFNILCWTYGIRIFDSRSPLSAKKVLLNPNILALILGALTLVLKIRLSGPLEEFFNDTAGMIGPLSMMITGMVIGSMSIKELFANRRIFLVILFRFVLCCAAAVAIIKLTGMESRIAEGHTIALISLLSAAAPSASNMNQLAIIYNHDAKYASAINVVTTLLCIIFIPFWVFVLEHI